jgi:hypothetical protein
VINGRFDLILRNLFLNQTKMIKQGLLSALLVFVIVTGMSQTVPRLSKFEISNSGCAVYFPGDPGELTTSSSEDGSTIWQSEIENNKALFGFVIVEFKQPLTADITEEVLISYMDFLKTSMEINESAGYGKGHVLESHPEAKGVVDFWKATDGTEYKVKGWVDTRHLAFLYVAGYDTYPYQTIIDLFLDGFRFPASGR